MQQKQTLLILFCSLVHFIAVYVVNMYALSP